MKKESGAPLYFPLDRASSEKVHRLKVQPTLVCLLGPGLAVVSCDAGQGGAGGQGGGGGRQRPKLEGGGGQRHAGVRGRVREQQVSQAVVGGGGGQRLIVDGD